MASRVAFFLEHAGWSHLPGADLAEKEASREECCRQLAEAEEMAASRGWYVTTEYDHDDCADPDDGETAAKLTSGELERLIVLLCDEDGSMLAGLGSVIVGSDGDPYVRVVAAELALELLAEEMA